MSEKAVSDDLEALNLKIFCQPWWRLVSLGHAPKGMTNIFSLATPLSKLILCGDIETNPGPAFNNSAKTIHAPYSQGNIDIFGEDAGRQCVPMSLCSLIYLYRNNSICDSSDLVNIINLGNQLYSTLSRLSRQMYLLLDKLPTMITVDDTDYSLELSQSYTGNLHLPVMNESVPFVMPLDSALEQLQQEAFHSFLLTIEYNTVSIFTESNSVVKIFDFHARDSFGMPHPHGTCVLLEFHSVRNLIGYFKFLYRPGVIYEIKGVKINYVSDNLLQNVNTNISDTSTISNDTSLHSSASTVAQETVNNNSIFNTQSYYIFIYSICFSTIKRCNYWNYQTENGIVEHAIELFSETHCESQLSPDLPEFIQIYGSTIQVTYSSRHKGTLCCTSEVSKVALAELIFANTVHSTGFLLWLQSIPLACIIENNMSVKKEHQKKKYFLLAPDETRELNLFKQLPDSHSVVGRLYDVLKLNEPDLDEAKYIIQFLSIPCTLAKLEKQRIRRKHKSNDQKNMVRKNNKNNYNSMSPVKKQALHEKQAMVYKAMDSSKKEAYRERSRANMKRKYHSMNEQHKKFKSNSEDVNLDHSISKFQSRIKEGPYYICSVCNRLLYSTLGI